MNSNIKPLQGIYININFDLNNIYISFYTNQIMTENIHGTAVLSDRDIKREIAAGNIILYDPDNDCESNIQNCSVDVTLGSEFYRNESRISYFNPWNEKHVNAYWGKVKQASTICDILEEEGSGMKIGDKYIFIKPGESILGHTREFIGGLNHITTMVKARSSMGRSGITICRDAGWGDIGYYNRFTLEITNNGTSPVILPVGARVGQIIFLYTGTPNNTYAGKYQTGDSLEEVVKNWDPTMMLPRAYLDK